MKAIVLVDSKFGIAKGGRQMVHISDDLRHFSKLTRGETIIMGHKTYENLPGRRPLEDRRNIVISHGQLTGLYADKFEVHTLDEIMENPEYDDAWVIGGGQIYSSLLSRIQIVYATVLTEDFECDTFFPKIFPTFNDYKPEYGTWKAESEMFCHPGQGRDGKTHPFYYFTFERMVE